MKSKFAIAALIAAVATPMIASSPVQAQYYGGYDNNRYAGRDYGRGYDRSDAPRGYYNGDRRYYRGQPVRYNDQCRRSEGTTGLIAGGAGGALIGKAFGGDTLGTVLGALGGGLLGRELDRRHDTAQNYRNGC